MNQTVDLTIKVVATGHCSLLLPLTDFSLVLLFSHCSCHCCSHEMDPQNRLSISFRVMHPRVVTRRFAVSQHRSVEEVLGAGPIARVKLDRAIDGHQPSSSTSICSSV